MKTMNRITLVGHLAADPELKQTKSGKSFSIFSIATNRFTLSADGEKKEVADFHKIVAFGKLADVCAKYLKKGAAALVEGALVNTSYEDKEGIKRYRSEILLDALNMLSPKAAASSKS